MNDETGSNHGQEAATDAETRYRMFFEHSPDGILIIDPETMKFIEFNTAAHRQLGYTRDEFAKLSIPDVEAKETARETGEMVAHVLKVGRNDFETLQRARDGQLRNVFVTAQIVNILGRRVYQCVWRDITNQKKVEKSLLESEERLQQSEELYKVFISFSCDMVFLKDEGFRYRISNEAMSGFLGKKTEEVIGKTDFDLMAEMPALRCRSTDTQALASDNACVNEETVGNLCFETRKFRVKLNNGKMGVGGYVRDITDRKLVEEKLKGKMEELESFNKFAVNRELKMIELKKKIAEFEEKRTSG